MNRIFKIIMDILIVLLIILLLGYFVLRVMGILTIYKVETGSMEDGIHAGDYILIIKKNNYYKNEIVTYQKDEYFITHRIIKKDGDRITTKGDANNTIDEEIDIDDIVGKVVYSGKLLNFVIDYKFLIAGILIALYLVSYYIEEEKKKKMLKE